MLGSQRVNGQNRRCKAGRRRGGRTHRYLLAVIDMRHAIRADISAFKTRSPSVVTKQARVANHRTRTERTQTNSCPGHQNWTRIAFRCAGGLSPQAAFRGAHHSGERGSVLLTLGLPVHRQGLGGCVCVPINKLTSVCWSDAWFARCRLFGWFLAVFVRSDWPVAARRREWCDEKDRAVPAGTFESHGGLRCPLSHYCARCVISVVAVTLLSNLV